MQENNLKIALLSDANAAWEIIQACAVWLRNNGIQQWTDEYPTFQHIERDIEVQHLYGIWLSDALIGCFCLSQETESEYSQLNWSGENPIYLHRMAIAPSVQRSGIGTKTMSSIFDLAKANGHDVLRLATYGTNHISKNFYLKNGFTLLGEIVWEGYDFGFPGLERKL